MLFTPSSTRLGRVFLEQLAHQLLTLAVLGAHKPVWRHLDQPRPLAAEHA